MKKAALIFFVAALLLGGAVLWGFLNATLDIRAESVAPLQPKQERTELERLARLMEISAVRGVVYDAQPLLNLDDYTVLQYTLIVRNRGLIQADMLEVQIMPVSGDVLCYSQQDAQGIDVNQGISAGPGQTIRLHCYLLTKKGTHAVRDLHVSYYVWGNPFFIKLTYG